MGFIIGQAIPIRYYHGATGVTIKARIVDEADALFGAELTLTENAALLAAGHPGFYETTFTPDAIGHWKVILYYGGIRVGQMFYYVGGGFTAQETADVENAAATGAITGLESFDLDHLLKVAHPTGDPVADTMLDLIMNKDAGQTFNRATDSLEVTGENLASIIADVGVFPTANYATLAAYVEDIRTRLVAAQVDLDNPAQYKADVTNLDVAVSTRLATAAYTAERGTDSAALASTLEDAMQKATTPTYNQDTDSQEAIREAVDLIPTTAMRGTDSAALASVATEARLAELDAANLPADIAAIPTTAMRGTDNAALASTLEDAMQKATGPAYNQDTDSQEAIREAVDAIPTTAMRGTDDALLAASYTAERGTDSALLAANYVTERGTDSAMLAANGALEATFTHATYGLDKIKTETAAIKAKTDNLPVDPADASDIATAHALLATVAKQDIIDTNVDAVLVDTATTIPGLLSTIQTDLDTPAQYKADLTTLETRLSAVRAGNIDTIHDATFVVSASIVDDVANSSSTFETDLANVNDDYYNDMIIVFTSGADVIGQARRILDYDGATKFITVSAALNAEPTAGDDFQIIPQVVAAAAAGGDATTANQNTIIALLDPEVANILADTNEVQLALANGGFTDLLIDAIKAKTDNLPVDPADASDIAAAHALLATEAKQDIIDTNVDDIEADTNEIQISLANGGFTDLLIDAIKAKTDVGATEAKQDIIDGVVDNILADTATIVWGDIATIDGLIDAITADIGVFPTANYATLAAYVEDIRTRLVAIVADTGAIAWGDITAILGLVDSAEAAGPFSYLDAGGEQDVYEDTVTTRRRITVRVSNRNMTQTGTFRIYVKEDGANYDQYIEQAVLIAAGEDRSWDRDLTLNQHWKITYEEDVDEGANRDIPYNIIAQVIE